MLHAVLYKFENNIWAYSEEQGERFLLNIIEFERRFQRQNNENMIGNYIESSERKYL